MYFEMPPFEDCPYCKARDMFGILSIGSNSYSRRCKECRKTVYYQLPKLEKKVIYLDQFVISNLMKAANNSFRPNVTEGERLFWADLYKLVDRLVLLQVAVFPDSLIHLHESLTSPYYPQLKKMYEKLSGGLSLQDHYTIAQSQLSEYANFWIQGNQNPEILFDVDSILHGNRNAWLSHFLITTNVNFSDEMIEGLRTSRDTVHEDFSLLFKQWREQGQKDFSSYVAIESAAYGKGIIDGIFENLAKILKAQTGAYELTLNDVVNNFSSIFTILKMIFMRHGVIEENVFEMIIEFLKWDGLRNVPFNKIESYLFAAIARKAASGQITPPSCGMMSDINMIAAYMPYCDAIFVDNYCAGLMKEQPLCDDLNYTAKIFSLTSKQEFMDYLISIERTANDEVRKNAALLYGIEGNL